MALTVSEKTLDSKRRIVIPSELTGLKGRSKVAMIKYDDAAVIIASTKQVANELSNMLHQAETKRKLKALDEWEGLVEKAGLANISEEKIDRAVQESIRRPKKLIARQ